MNGTEQQLELWTDLDNALFKIRPLAPVAKAESKKAPAIMPQKQAERRRSHNAYHQRRHRSMVMGRGRF